MTMRFWLIAAVSLLPGPVSGARAADPASARYQCSDGQTLNITYHGMDAVVIVLGGDRIIQMKRALSADGARYTGDGWQWWGKGLLQGRLAPLGPGEQIASKSGVACSRSLRGR